MIVENATGSSTPGCEPDCFIPSIGTINEGGKVIFKNNDNAAHTSTSGTPTDGPSGVWDSSLVMPGSSYSVTLDESGTYPYFCMVHPWMTGEVIVEGIAELSQDIVAPTFFPEPKSIHIQTSNPIGSVVYYTKPLPIDDSYIIDDTKCTPPSGTLFPYGNTIVVCTATDAAGNVGNSTFTVTVSDSPADTIPPTIITPSYLLYKINDADAIEVVLGAAPQWQKTHQMVYEVTVLDNSEDVIKPKCTPPSGTFFPVGITPVTCTATDSSGNTASASFDVTVLAYNDISDKSPPTISATSDIIKYVSQTTGTPVTYSIPTAYDDSGLDGSVLCMPMSGTLFIIGTTTVTCTVSDNVGNTATSSFDVTILVLDIDLSPPTFSETEDITKLAINPSGIAVQYFTPTAFDQSPLDGSVTCTPSSGTLFPVGKTIVTCSVSDFTGNIGTTAFTVTVTLYNEGGN
jgi:hypothetical protein